MCWINVKDRMPEEGQVVDIWGFYKSYQFPQDIKNGERIPDCKFLIDSGGGETNNCFCRQRLNGQIRDHEHIPENNDVTHWRLKPEVPIGI
jgi:hypothetical protein